MRPAFTLALALLGLQGISAFGANLEVLERELAQLDAGADAPKAAGILTGEERQERLQEQVADLRKAVESARRVVVVNVPAFTLTAYEDGKPVLESRVIVGSPQRKTPLRETEVTGVQFNPAWSAPSRVVKGDLTRNGVIDEQAVRRKGLTVLDDQGNPLPPDALSFIPADQAGRLRYYHPPGDGNALGRLKVTLKGLPDIYLHDTPNKSLFAKSRRALSSGCVRVEKARELAAWLTGKSAGEIDELIAGNATRTVEVQATKVVLGYWLADTVNDRAVYVDDIYRMASSRRGAPQLLAAKTADDPIAALIAAKEAETTAQVASEKPAADKAGAEKSAESKTASSNLPAATTAAATSGAATIAAAPPAASAPAPRRAFVSPANASPWVDYYIRSALAGLQVDALRYAVNWQMPPRPSTGAATVVTLTIDRNGNVRATDLGAARADAALRALTREHFARHSRTLPFPEPLARDVDELMVPVTLTLARG